MPRHITDWSPLDNCDCTVHIDYDTVPPSVIRGGVSTVVSNEVQISWQDATGVTYALNDSRFIKLEEEGPSIVELNDDGTFKATPVTPRMTTVLRNHIVTPDKKCPFHRHLDDAAWLAELQKEDKARAAALAIVNTVIPDLKGGSVTSYMDLQRQLIVSFEGIEPTNLEKDAIQAVCDTQIKTTKVVLK